MISIILLVGHSPGTIHTRYTSFKVTHLKLIISYINMYTVKLVFPKYGSGHSYKHNK